MDKDQVIDALTQELEDLERTLPLNLPRWVQ
jgi:hypothetical protein